MFDRNLFDRNAYDRSVASEGIIGTILSTSDLKLSIVLTAPVPLKPFVGTSDMQTGMTVRILANPELDGEGDMDGTQVVLRLAMTAKLTGTSSMQPGVTARTPFASALSGGGDFKSEQDFVRQRMASAITGTSSVGIKMVVQTPFAFSTKGTSELKGSTVLRLPLSINLSGNGEMDLRRIGGLNENIFELTGINLQPGEEVTIDTDILDVLFGYRYDVSSVSVDSVFFELNPGENEITVGTDINNGPIRVTTIWQNRWL